MKDLKVKMMAVAGVGLIAFASYWYLIAHEDPSQFISFTMIGCLIMLFSIVVKEMERLRDRVNYFDDMMTEEYDKRIKKRKDM